MEIQINEEQLIQVAATQAADRILKSPDFWASALKQVSSMAEGNNREQLRAAVNAALERIELNFPKMEEQAIEKFGNNLKYRHDECIQDFSRKADASVRDMMAEYYQQLTPAFIQRAMVSAIKQTHGKEIGVLVRKSLTKMLKGFEE